jgi:uncharacterized RDD family membrane protein YckC
MFMILGGDGNEYGPATVAQIRAWIDAGRANLDTKAKALGSDEWRRLQDYAEFGGPGDTPPLLAGPTPGTAPAPGAAVAPELAGRGIRTGAAVVNALIYFLCMMPGSVQMSRRLLEEYPELAKGGIPQMDQIDLTVFAQGILWVWAGILGAMFVQTLLLTLRGQNIGKLLFGARVVRFDNGQPAGFVRGALLRFLLPVSIMILLNLAFPLGLLFLAVDYAFIFRADRRCLHDLIAGTMVVRA